MSNLTVCLSTVETLWPSVNKFVYAPHNEAEYEQLVDLLNRLIDLVRDDETHLLASLMEVIGLLMENYEKQHDTDRWVLSE